MIKKFASHRPFDPCLPFQIDLSTLVDDELDEGSVSRTLVHLETCPGCRDFLQSIRGGVVVHRQLADPERLARVLAMLEETKIFPSSDPRTQLRRLAAVYYRLGKAYVMLTLDKKYQFRLLEEPVAIQDYKVSSRHFVERQILRRPGEGVFRGYDWVKARYLLNGRLDDEGNNLDKGCLLLEEALTVRPHFAEPRLFLALSLRYRGRIEEAKALLQWVLDKGRKPISRVCAAIQMGHLYGVAEDFRNALRYSRWALRQKLDDSEAAQRAAFGALYNTGIYYAQMGRHQRAAEFFGRLLRRFPGRDGEVGDILKGDRIVSELIRKDARLAGALESVSPALVMAAN